MSLVKLLIPLTALICELMFIFSSAAFLWHKISFLKQWHQFSLSVTALLFLAALVFLKVNL